MAPNKLEKLRQKYQEKVDAFQVTASSPTVSVEAPVNKEREYTDKCFIAVLIMTPLMMMMLGGVGWATGNFTRLGSGIDGQGRLCYDLPLVGNNDHSFKYVYYPDLGKKGNVRFFPEPLPKTTTIAVKSNSTTNTTNTKTNTTNTKINSTQTLAAVYSKTKVPFITSLKSYQKNLDRTKYKDGMLQNVDQFTYNYSRPSSVCVKECPTKTSPILCEPLDKNKVGGEEIKNGSSETKSFSRTCVQLQSDTNRYNTIARGTDCVPADVNSKQYSLWQKRNLKYKFPAPVKKPSPPPAKKPSAPAKKPSVIIKKPPATTNTKLPTPKKPANTRRSLYSSYFQMELDANYLQTLATATTTPTTAKATPQKEVKEPKEIDMMEIIKVIAALMICSTISIVVSIIYLQVLALHPLYVTLGGVLIQLGCIIFYLVSAMAMEALYDGPPLAWILAFVMFGYLIASCCYCICMFCNQGNTAAIIEGSAQYMSDTKRVMFIPVFYWFIGLMTTVITMFFVIGCVSTTKPGSKSDEQWGMYSKTIMPGLLVLFGIPMLGICNYFMEMFFGYKLYYIMSHAVSSYYFNSNKEQEGSAEVMEAFKTSFKHVGSFSFGAFLMTLIMIIKKIAEAVEAAHDDTAEGACAAVTKIIICCIRKLLNVIEEIIDMLSKASYSYMSISGESYCQSGKNGFLLYLKHLFSLAAVFFVTNSIQFIGACTCTAVAVCGSQIIAGIILGNSSATFVCVFLVFFLANFTSNQFLEVFESAVYQMLLCFAFDKDLHMGEVNYGPPKLHYTLEENMKDKDDVQEQLMNETPDE